MTQLLYGPPPEMIQDLYGPPSSFQPLYGNTVNPVVNLFSIIFSPFLIVVSFVIGTILFLLTNKKIFIIIPLVFSLLYLALQLIDLVFGIAIL